VEKRYFEFQGADAKRGTSNSSKFWEVWIDGTTLHTRFGKIGANGQTTIKDFPDLVAAQKALDKAVAEKLKKGYAEFGAIGKSATPSEQDDDQIGLIEEDHDDRGGPHQPLGPSHPLVLEADGKFNEWWSRYHPIAATNFELSEIPFDWDPAKVWSEVSFEEGQVIIPGFSPGGGTDLIMEDDIVHHWFTDVPFNEVDQIEWITTEVRTYCQNVELEEEWPCEVCPRGDICLQTNQFFDIPSLRKPSHTPSSLEELEIALGVSAAQGDENHTDSRRCQECRFYLSDTAKFCSSCGAEVKFSPSFCSQCGSKRADGARFCGDCGEKF